MTAAMTIELGAPDLRTIRDLVEPSDPVACVYLGLEPPEPTLDSWVDLELRWRAMAASLTSQGTPQATVDAVAAKVRALEVYPSELALFAADGRILLRQEIAGEAPFDRASFVAPAQVAPLLAWLQRHPAYVAVLTDRTGAEVTAVAAGARSGVTHTVVGPDDEIERNAPGGWSQPRYQRRAEDSWRHNAGAVAEAAAKALNDVGAQLLLVGGDVRAVQLLREQLPHGLSQRVRIRELPGGRSVDGSAAARTEAVAAQRAAHAQEQMSGRLELFVAERGPHGLAVEGVANTLAALAAGRVRTLLIVDEPGDERTAWFGPDLLCVDESSRAAAGGVVTVRRGRMVDIAVRAALLTDAEVRIVAPADAVMAERIGALCRFIE